MIELNNIQVNIFRCHYRGRGAVLWVTCLTEYGNAVVGEGQGEISQRTIT